MCKISESVQKLNELTQSVWLQKPAEVDRVRGRLGARNQNFTIVSYAESNTSAVVDCLHNMRVTAKQQGVDIPSLAAATINVISFYSSRFTRYYDMVDIPQAMDLAVEALKEVKSAEDYLKVVEALDSYVGKMNYWLDLEIPWDELGKEFTRIKCK